MARALFQKLDLDGRKVSLDALPTQDQTARELVLEPGADYLFTAKDNQPTLRANIEKLVPAPPTDFPPQEATTTLADQREFNQGQPELRVLRSCASSAEAMGFPGVAQVALRRRHRRQHAPATVALVPSRPPAELHAAPGRACNRAAWGIESGRPQRLDVSPRDDQGRVRQPQSMRVIGMFRRFSNSLFIKWRRRQQNPRPPTTTDCCTAMNAEHHRDARRCRQARQPSFRSAS